MTEPSEPKLPFTITLELEHRDDNELRCKLPWASSEPYKVEEYNVNAIGAAYFTVLQGEQQVPYVGPLARPDDDELELSPDEPVVSEVRLDQHYAFAPGKHGYTVQYEAAHYPAPDYEQMVSVSSDVVEVEHEAPGDTD